MQFVVSHKVIAHVFDSMYGSFLLPVLKNLRNEHISYFVLFIADLKRLKHLFLQFCKREIIVLYSTLGTQLFSHMQLLYSDFKMPG
jgi:hypothetical protein